MKQTYLRDVKVMIRGVAPLMLHRGMMADPLDDWALAQKKITGKTAAAHAEKGRIDFQGGLVHDPKVGPYIPDFYIEKNIANGATKAKKGKAVTAGVMCKDEMNPILYDGPRDRNGLWESGKFFDRRIVVIGRNKVIRVRPRFNEWSLGFELTINTETINISDVEEALHVSGSMYGLGDYRPKFGRFIVEDFKIL